MTLYAGESDRREQPRSALAEHEEHRLFEKTVAYWHRWLGRCTYTGRWREMVYRSALTLKLLIYEPTGAMVAAPTCSLPEAIGGERNWDYRYTWIRDAAFALYALIKIGYDEEAAAFMEWIMARCRELDDGGSLQPLYTLDGQPHIRETDLDHLEGYRQSRPVRNGNAAYGQFQLDIYGPLLDSIYLYNKHCQFITYELWSQIERLLNWVCDNWQRKDRGIWEVRGDPQHFVYSKLMCWVALDRGLRIADKRGFPAERSRWIETRDQIYREIIAKGWNAEREAFVQYYGGEGLDAANLIMPLMFFTSPEDTRFLHTLHAIMQPAEAGGLMTGEMIYRYNRQHTDDGLSGGEGTFNMCTFWLAEALTRNGQIDRARLIYERMLGYANHVGLYAEQTGMRGEALGNFPQALTHLSLISAALSLDQALEPHQG